MTAPASIQVPCANCGKVNTVTLAAATVPAAPPVVVPPIVKPPVVVPPIVKPPVVTPPAPVSASGQAMPIGDLPGWHQVAKQDFAIDVPVGGFVPDSNGHITSGPYANLLDTYPPEWTASNGLGRYDAAKVLSTSDGLAQMNLHTAVSSKGDTLPLSATVALPEARASQIYGRWTYRMRATATGPNWGIVSLLWPTKDSDWPGSGEVDFVEGDPTQPLHGFNHFADPSGAQAEIDPKTPLSWGDWHTYDIQWTKNHLVCSIDGTAVLDTTDRVPSEAMRWLVQSGPNGAVPAPGVTATWQMDWVTVYQPA